MSKSSDIVIRAARYSTQQINYRTPIKFGGRVVVDVVLANVEVDVESRDGRQATGRGSMPMGNVWAWPSQQVTTEQSLRAMMALSERLTNAAARHGGSGHAVELTHALARDYGSHAQSVVKTHDLSEPMPRLAQLVCASPVEAAIHDAYGRVLGKNSYDVLGPEYMNADLAPYLDESFAGEYLEQYTLRAPKTRMPLYHLVGALDPLSTADVERAVGDGLPETLAEWIVADGLTHLKIKLAGDDLAWDLQRVAEVERVAGEAQAGRGCTEWFYSLDFNEKCPNVQYVLDFLGRLEETAPSALERVQYIEQPTHRDLRANPENRMHEAAKIKPVVIDESLIDYESLLIAREQGYSGVALKACKGQTEALLMGAAAQKYGMFLCVQDLTCVGASLLHSASIAARIPTVAAIEANGRQYCPAGNRGWDRKYPEMFDIRDGTVGTHCLGEAGLGFSWPESE